MDRLVLVYLTHDAPVGMIQAGLLLGWGWWGMGEVEGGRRELGCIRISSGVFL